MLIHLYMQIILHEDVLIMHFIDYKSYDGIGVTCDKKTFMKFEMLLCMFEIYNCMYVQNMFISKKYVFSSTNSNIRIDLIKKSKFIYLF